MPQYCCWCFTLKTCAYITALFDFVWGVSLVNSGVGYVYVLRPRYPIKNESANLFVMLFITLGVSLICNAFLLLYGIIKTKENCIFLCVILGSTNLFVLTVITCLMGVFEIKMFICIFVVLWYSQFCVYSFYKEIVKKYGTDSNTGESYSDISYYSYSEISKVSSV